MLRALIWDVDGTLAETEHDGHRVAFNTAFAQAGLPWVWDEATYARLLGTTGGKERIARWWAEVDPHTAGHATTAGRIAALHAAKTALYVRQVAAGAVALRPGVRRLLVEARAARLRLAIATTSSPENVQALLRATLGEGGPALFDAIGAGDVVPAKKPAPDIYAWVLRRLGLRPDQCVAVEDSGPGAQAARAAGLPTLVTRSRYSRGEPMPAGLLADLDGLGEHAAPARGIAAGQPWRGLVSVPQLQAWCDAGRRVPGVAGGPLVPGAPGLPQPH